MYLQSALEELDSSHTQISRLLQENAELKRMMAALQENQRLLEVIYAKFKCFQICHFLRLTVRHMLNADPTCCQRL